MTQTVPGVVHVRARVTEKVAREAAAAVIGSSRDEIDVELSEWSGGLAVRVAARLPIPDLEDTVAVQATTPILDRARQVQSALAGELARLTGRKISRVSLTVTGAIVLERKRVR